MRIIHLSRRSAVVDHTIGSVTPKPERRRQVAIITASAVLVPIALAATAPEQPTAPETISSLEEDAALEECVAVAMAEESGPWFCMGGDLTSTSLGDDGELISSTRTVADYQVVDTTNEVDLMATDYDTWCETKSVCWNQISDYIVVVKGNASYGLGNTQVGAFDIIWRQAFNGPYPRWRLTLKWDKGATVDPIEFKASCRRHISGSPDEYCGTKYFYPNNVSSGSKWAYSPSATGYLQSGTKLSGGSTRKYHDDLSGTFSAVGYSYVWTAGTLHTGRWNHCGSSTGCKYYQVPWTTSP